MARATGELASSFTRSRSLEPSRATPTCVLRDMLCAFGDRMKAYIDSKRDYYKVLRSRPREEAHRDLAHALAFPDPCAPQVILNFLQICTQHLGGVVRIDWPPFYKGVMSNLNFVNLNFLS